MPTEPEPRSFDCVIIGQGLAGSTLAWQLHWRGQRCLLIDRDDCVTSSKVAGGLMTPVTGQRVVPTWRLDEFWPAAVSFYQRVEAETDTRLLHQPGQVRLFQSQVERQRFEQRDLSGISTPIQQPEPLIDADEFQNEFGGFEMPSAGRLDVRGFLDATQSAFESAGLLQRADIDYRLDIQPADEAVEFPRLGVRADSVVFCEGFAARDNPWLAGMEFDATRGELLTIRVPGLHEQRIVGCGVWLAPLGDGLFRAGSTYDWNNLDAGPTDAGRDELCSRLQRFLKLPFEVVGHDAGVRPIVVGRHPVLGLIPGQTRLVVFNGLGSKGALQAPFLAAQLAELLVAGRPVDDSVEFTQRFNGCSGKNLHSEVAEAARAFGMPSSRKPWRLPLQNCGSRSIARQPRLTERAHQAVRGVVNAGDLTIDSTAGNGHDTCFLAESVGPDGSVVALDVQPDALECTRDRLRKNGFDNVTTILGDHANLAGFIPEDQHGNVAAVMFNLGYLPGGDKTIVTRPESTVNAIQSALDMLRPGGVITILVYPGHPGGEAEAAAVLRLLESLDGSVGQVDTLDSSPATSTSPRLHIVTKSERVE